MNPKIQTILDTIQNSRNLTVEEKDLLLKSLEDAEKELEITAFKLERTGQVRKTTAILLEETIAELEEKRKAVENQNRELEIEAALERVRTVAMSMHKSDDLINICEISFKEFQKLGFTNIRNAIIHIPDDDQKFFMDYDFSELFGAAITKIEYGSHPIVDEYLKQIRSAEDAFFQIVIKKDQLQGWNDFRKKSGQYDDPRLENAAALYYYLFSIGIGDIGISTFNPIDDYQIKILKRFRNVFSLSYQRYSDLALAEAQAREAQIEAALEKVRAAAMGMNKPGEILNIGKILFNELKRLGFADIRNTLISIFNDDEGFFQDYDYSDLLGGSISKVFYNSHPAIENFLNQVRKTDDAFAEHAVDRNQMNKWEEFRKIIGKKPDPRLEKIDFLYYYNYSIGSGSIGVSSFKPINRDQLEILKRFRNVFELSYRRYNDIALAEAQAREAQIEASLERVRSSAMAMHNSNDISSTTTVVFEELRRLNIQSKRCGVALLSENSYTGHIYAAATSSDGKLQTLRRSIEMTQHKSLKHQYESWKKQENYFIEMTGEELKSYYKLPFFYSSPDYVPPGNYEKTEYGYYLSFPEGLFYAWSENPYTEDEIDILKRFKRIVELTFRRFFDLQKAEAQAREAIKQASLDRVRGEIASMRTAEDLNRITPVIWGELKTLEVPFIRCGVFIVNEVKENVQIYLTTPDGKSLAVLNLSFDANELTSNTLDHWRKKQAYKEHWNKHEFINWTKSMMELGQVQDAETYQGSSEPPESLYLHFVPFTQGMLYVGDVSPLAGDKLELVKTLAEAFSIAYARYEDFKNLEEAKNKIELTLRDLKSAQAQLIHSEKMASLGELTAGIAHEIKNPLNFVNNFSELSKELLDEIKTELQNNNKEEILAILEDLKQNLEKINQHGKRADSIVKGMLLHSRGSSGEKVLTNINDLLDQYVTLAYHGMRAQNKEFNITIEKNYDESLEKINVVPQDISRVFLNIINNACYAAYDEKKKSDDDFSPLLKVSTKGFNGKVEIRIGDNGNGIPSDILDKIFQPFFTTKPTGEGTGLGLSLAYDIVKTHGGELKVETKEGEGTEFIIILNN